MSGWIIAAIILVIAIVLFLMYKFGMGKQVFEILLYLVSVAEDKFGGGTGELKFSAVTTWIYEKVPIIKFIFTKKGIDKLIERAVIRMKEYLAKNAAAAALVGTGVIAGATIVDTKKSEGEGETE